MLHASAQKGDCRQCKKLLQEGLLINATNFAGLTALHEACIHGHCKVAKILISSGADIDAASNNGNTPLHYAVRKGCEKLVWLLLHYGANREKPNYEGKRPIDMCPQQFLSIHLLLTTPSLPEKYPSSSNTHDMSSSSETHAEVRSPFTVAFIASNVLSPKQLSLSSTETGATVRSETFIQNKTTGYHRNIYLNEYKEQRGNLNDDLDHILVIHENEKDHLEADDAVGEVGFQKGAQEMEQRSVEVCPVQRGTFWNSEEATSLKNDEALEVEAEDGDRESTMQHNEELPSAETRKWARTRSTPRKVAVSQDKASFGDKRKQRGRRRGKVTTSARSVPLPHPSTSEDVYEFRESPEPDHENTQLEMDESGFSPDTKRQRIEGTFVHSQTVQASAKREEKRQIEVSETHKSCPCSSEITEEANGSRKVPPLRISLPRTPSEDNPASVSTDEVAPVAPGTRNSSKRNSRVGKNQSKKEFTPEDSATPPPIDNGMHRMTRSRVRQVGRTIKDDIVSGNYFETGVKRRGQNSTRRNGIPPDGVASPVGTGEKEEVQDNNADPNLFANGSGNSGDDNHSFGPVDAVNAFSLSLMKKNTYEGYRELRMKIEESWIDAMSLPPSNPIDLPANYEDYMILKKGFTLKSNFDSSNLASKQEINVDLTPELSELQRIQEERRQRMTIKHKIERERLQMLAEREILRMLNRKANPERETMSAVRVQHESNIFNAWYLKERCRDHPIMEYEEVKKKFVNEVRLMENRQKMESDALFAEQVYTWNGMLRNLGLLSVPSLKDNVPKVIIPHVELKL